MTILALEFSSDVRSMACVADGRVLARAAETGGRSTRAFALIEQVLQQAGIEREAVDCLALGVGPGSYTGIRVAIAIAQGWQVARGIRLLAVSTADCLAEQARLDGTRGRIHVAIDAQRNEFYHAIYELAERPAQPAAPLRLATLVEIQAAATEAPLLTFSETASRIPGARPVNPDAGTLGLIAAPRRNFIPGEQLQPVYLREIAFVKAPPPRAITLD